MARWGIAGTGSMAESLLEDLQLVPGAELVAIGSRSRERATDFARQHDVAEALTYAEIVQADLDVLHLATPHPQHRDLALAAIAHGLPVVVEKAFTATLDGARQVVAAARGADVFCMEAMWTRLQPAVIRARELVEAGAIGDLLLVQADLGAYRTYDESSRIFDPALGGGALLDLGVYAVSLAQHFLGTPASVTATGTTYPNGADASAVLHLDYGDGRAASVVCGLITETPGRAVIAGTGGSIEIAPRFHHPTRIALRRNGADPETFDLPARGRGYTHQIEHVERCLREGRTESPVVPLADTLGVQWVLGEALAQLGITPREAEVPGLPGLR